MPRMTSTSQPARRRPSHAKALMNLKWYLITRIWMLAFLCLLLASGHVLWKTEREQQRQLASALETVSKQIRNRLTTAAMGFSTTGFDRDGRFLFWNPTVGSEIMAGICIRYIDERDNVRASSCQGWPKANRHNRWQERVLVPGWFAAFYRFALSPGEEAVLWLSWDGRSYGRVVAALDPDNQIAEAWHDISTLTSLTVVTVLALCLLVYFVVSHALRPTREILSGLQRLEQGDLGARLPQLPLSELQKMSDGFNRLAASLEQSIAERAELTRKLVNVQEEERRYLARELHDEFGQCLAAINAVAASVTQTAEQERSSLVSEGEKLSRIAGHMMVALRSMLNRLRPPGIDELGLVESIEGLVAEYGSRGTQVELDASGNFGRLSETITVSVFRIVQECLTNVSKHAGATRVKVKLEWSEPAQSEHAGGSIDLTVEDDGRADDLSFVRGTGMGLLGMRERVAALGGQLTLRTRETRGLVVHARIPVVATP